MSQIIESIDVDVPVRVAYDQWTQFESFPKFMEGIERVVQLDDKTLEWTANVAGKVKHWRAEITEQRPDEVVAWRSTEGAQRVTWATATRRSFSFARRKMSSASARVTVNGFSR